MPSINPGIWKPNVSRKHHEHTPKHRASILRLHRVGRCSERACQLGKYFRERTKGRNLSMSTDSSRRRYYVQSFLVSVFMAPFSNPVGVRMGSIRRCACRNGQMHFYDRRWSFEWKFQDPPRPFAFYGSVTIFRFVVER